MSHIPDFWKGVIFTVAMEVLLVTFLWALGFIWAMHGFAPIWPAIRRLFRSKKP